MLSLPPHLSTVAGGASGFSDPPPSTPTTANSQKNCWVSAPARACPASASPILLIEEAPGLQPSYHPRLSGCVDREFGPGRTQRGPGLQPWLLKSHTPPYPDSLSRPPPPPTTPPSSFPDSCLSPHWLQQVTTGSALVTIIKPEGLPGGATAQLAQKGGGSLGVKLPPGGWGGH